MNNKHHVHKLIISDESHSMESIKQPTIEGFNEILQTIKGVEPQFPEQEHFISLVSFIGLFAVSLSITNVMKFKKDARAIKDFLIKEDRARYAYSEKIRNNLTTENNFYEETK